MACSMMLFPFLHIPSIPSPNYVIVVAPTWALPVWTLGLCWTVRPGRVLLGSFSSTLYVRACRPITLKLPCKIRVDANYYHIHNSSSLLVFSLAVSSRFQCLPGRGLHPRALGAGSFSSMAIMAEWLLWLYGPTIYSILRTQCQYKGRNICNWKRGSPGPISRNLLNPRHPVRWSALL